MDSVTVLISEYYTLHITVMFITDQFKLILNTYEVRYC